MALWALPLSLAPVLLHFFFRRPPKSVEFGDLKLLARIAEKAKPRKKIRQWLILLMRFLTLFSLFFFFSRPILHWGAASSEGDGAALVILLDRSYSMQASASGLSRWDEALRDAEGALSSLKESDRSALIAFSDRIEYDSQSLTNRHSDLIAALKTLKPGFGATQALPALERAYKILANSAAANRSILILSDGARHGWSSPSDGAALRDWSAALPNYDPTVKILMMEPSRPMNNLSVDAVSPIADAASGLGKYRVTLKNWGGKPLSHWPVALETAEGERVTETLVDLLPEENKTVFLTAALPDAAGGAKAAARPDGLEADDSYFIVQNPMDRIKVLAAEDYAGTGVISGETYFLRQALVSGASPFEIQTVTLGQLKKTRLADYRVLVLADPSEIDRELGDLLRRFTSAGGAIFVTLGERYSAQALAEISDLLPCALDAVKETGGVPLQPGLNLPSERLDVAQYESEKIEMQRAVSASLKPDSVSWIYFADGSPLLAFSKDQRVALWLSSVDRSWNNFASKPLFAPLMRSVIETLAQQKGGHSGRGWVVGDAYQADVPGESPASDWMLADPTGATIALTVQNGKLSSPPLERPGLYQLRSKQPGSKPREWIAVNVDRKKNEGDLTVLSAKDCQAMLPKTRWIYLRGGERFLDDFLRVLRGKDLTRAFALIAGLFLLGEMTLLKRKNS